MDMDEAPSMSEHYKVYHESDHANVLDEERKDGPPSPMPEELRGLAIHERVERSNE
jgi:hypothetical protein